MDFKAQLAGATTAEEIREVMRQQQLFLAEFDAEGVRPPDFTTTVEPFEAVSHAESLGIPLIEHVNGDRFRITDLGIGTDEDYLRHLTETGQLPDVDNRGWEQHRIVDGQIAISYNEEETSFGDYIKAFAPVVLGAIVTGPLAGAIASATGLGTTAANAIASGAINLAQTGGDIESAIKSAALSYGIDLATDFISENIVGEVFSGPEGVLGDREAIIQELAGDLDPEYREHLQDMLTTLDDSQFISFMAGNPQAVNQMEEVLVLSQAVPGSQEFFLDLLRGGMHLSEVAQIAQDMDDGYYDAFEDWREYQENPINNDPANDPNQYIENRLQEMEQELGRTLTDAEKQELIYQIEQEPDFPGYPDELEIPELEWDEEFIPEWDEPTLETIRDEVNEVYKEAAKVAQGDTSSLNAQEILDQALQNLGIELDTTSSEYEALMESVDNSLQQPGQPADEIVDETPSEIPGGETPSETPGGEEITDVPGEDISGPYQGTEYTPISDSMFSKEISEAVSGGVSGVTGGAYTTVYNPASGETIGVSNKELFQDNRTSKVNTGQQKNVWYYNTQGQRVYGPRPAESYMKDGALHEGTAPVKPPSGGGTGGLTLGGGGFPEGISLAPPKYNPNTGQYEGGGPVYLDGSPMDQEGLEKVKDWAESASGWNPDGTLKTPQGEPDGSPDGEPEGEPDGEGTDSENSGESPGSTPSGGGSGGGMLGGGGQRAETLPLMDVPIVRPYQPPALTQQWWAQPMKGLFGE